MTGRSPARLLAPIALVVTAVALLAIVTSSGGDNSSDSSTPATATATATPSKQAAKKKAAPKPKTYTVEPGDIPSTIAEQQNVPLEDLLAANPDLDPSALTPGQKLKIP